MGRLHRSLFGILKFTERRGSVLRNMTSSEGDQSLARAFHGTMEKIEVDILQFAK